jgi:hypothetical protein
MIWRTSDNRNQIAMERTSGPRDDRFLLWVDAVGGYWVCLKDEIVLGQASAAGKADLPILGDVSAKHARIRRDGEGYLIEAFRDLRVDGRKVDHLAMLGQGARIDLGDSVRLVFRRPHALSATARLDFASRHHTEPSVDAVILMADSLVLGPKSHSHVVCRDWPCEVVISHHEGQLSCRTTGAFEIDGVRCQDRGPLSRTSRVVGAHFSLSLEPI